MIGILSLICAEVVHAVAQAPALGRDEQVLVRAKVAAGPAATSPPRTRKGRRMPWRPFAIKSFQRPEGSVNKGDYTPTPAANCPDKPRFSALASQVENATWSYPALFGFGSGTGRSAGRGRSERVTARLMAFSYS